MSTASDWLDGYAAGRRVGWLDALDFAMSRGESGIQPELLDEILDNLSQRPDLT